MLKINIEANSLAELHTLLSQLEQRITFSEASLEPAIKLGTPRKIIRKGRGWTDIELDKLVDWYKHSTFTTKEIAIALERPIKGVDQKLYHLRKEGLIGRRRSARAKTIN